MLKYHEPVCQASLKWSGKLPDSPRRLLSDCATASGFCNHPLNSANAKGFEGFMIQFTTISLAHE